jgi:DNA-binding protein HU-beta
MNYGFIATPIYSIELSVKNIFYLESFSFEKKYIYFRLVIKQHSLNKKRGLFMAAKPMTKGQILDHMAKKTGVTKKLAGQFLEELVALSYKEAKKAFTIPGLGKLVVVNRKKRMGRNPATGATMVIPAKRVLKFRIAKAAKDNAL